MYGSDYIPFFRTVLMYTYMIPMLYLKTSLDLELEVSKLSMYLLFLHKFCSRLHTTFL